MELINLRLKAIEQNHINILNEKEQLIIMKKSLEKIIEHMNLQLKGLKGIEHNLYYEIIVNGLNVNKAVDKVSLYEDISVSTIWKNYYPKVKNEIKKLKDKIANF